MIGNNFAPNSRAIQKKSTTEAPSLPIQDFALQVYLGLYIFNWAIQMAFDVLLTLVRLSNRSALSHIARSISTFTHIHTQNVAALRF